MQIAQLAEMNCLRKWASSVCQPPYIVLMPQVVRYIEWYRAEVEPLSPARRDPGYKLAVPPDLQLSEELIRAANVPLPAPLAVAPNMTLPLVARFLDAMFFESAPGREKPYSEVIPFTYPSRPGEV
jgi:hypothetical protein